MRVRGTNRDGNLCVVGTGEVEARELSKVFDCRPIVSSSPGYCASEQTKIFNSPSPAYRSSPSSLTGIPVNTFESGGVVDINFPISSILGVTALSKVSFSIIKPVLVPVVYVWKILSCYLSMHKDMFELPVNRLSSGRVESIRSFIPTSNPVELVEFLVAFCVDKSILPLRQWNDAIRWVERLLNIVTLHGAFHKEPPFLVRQVAALNYPNFIMLEAN